MSTNSSFPRPTHTALVASHHQPDTIPVLSYQCACGNPVYFDSSLCLSCGSSLGFDPLADRILPAANSRLCSNGTRYNVCNWLIPHDSPDDLCLACRLNRTIPDLTRPGNLPLWSRIEAAKRRALRSLVNMGLPLRTLAEDPDAGLAFDIVSHIADPAISTGYLAGVITINLEEADDVHRRISQQQLGESSRTLLGHFHHECGHYVWELAFAPWPPDHPIRAAFRSCFGDESSNYPAALARHYSYGPLPDWESSFISAYASSHPSEDWAETWAHYLHLTEAMETCSHAGIHAHNLSLPLVPIASNAASLPPPLMNAGASDDPPFLAALQRWACLTTILNEVSLSLGEPRLYPFVISTTVAQKLRLAHHVAGFWGRRPALLS
jgi:hypothetical protein